MADTAANDRRKLFKDEVAANLDALYGTALRMTRKPEDAEDLVADTVAKAWSALDGLKDTSQFRPWIFRILTNTFISDYRKSARAPKTESLDESSEGEDGDENFSLYDKLQQPFLLWYGNPEQEFVSKMLREDISQAIERLSDDFRTIVVLIDIEGFSYAEAADIMDVPVGTVRSRLKRARGQLQRALWQQAKDAGLDPTDQQKAGLK